MDRGLNRKVTEVASSWQHEPFLLTQIKLTGHEVFYGHQRRHRKTIGFSEKRRGPGRIAFPLGGAVRSQGGLSKAKSPVGLVCSKFSAFYAGLYRSADTHCPAVFVRGIHQHSRVHLRNFDRDIVGRRPALEKRLGPGGRNRSPGSSKIRTWWPNHLRVSQAQHQQSSHYCACWPRCGHGPAWSAR